MTIEREIQIANERAEKENRLKSLAEITPFVSPGAQPRKFRGITTYRLDNAHIDGRRYFAYVLGEFEKAKTEAQNGIPFKFEFDPKDNGHYLMFGSTREGMSGMAARPSLLPLSAPSQFEASVLMALGSQRNLLEADGVSLASLCRVLGMESTPEGDRRILDALKELKGLVPALSGLRYSESDGLVRAGDVLR